MTSTRQPRRLRRWRTNLAMAATAVVLIGTTLAATPAGAATPTIVATPNSGLIDGQVISVTVSGLTPNSPSGVVECVAGHDVDGCDTSAISGATTDASGGFTMPFQVETILHVPAGTFDCRVSDCLVASNTAIALAGAATTPIAFDPSGPLLPPPTATAVPDTDLIDGQTIAVNGSGFRSGHFVEVDQCATGANPAVGCQSTESSGSEIGADGTFTTPLVLHAILTTGGAGLVDCRTPPDACEVQVTDFSLGAEVITAPLSFDPDAPAVVPGHIDVSPTTDLVDGQIVHVTGANYGAGHQIILITCAQTANEGSCRGNTVATADGTGGFEADVRVRAVQFNGDLIDCRDPATICTLEAIDATDPFSFTAEGVALHFDPDAPLLPPPTLTVSPATFLQDGETVDVSGTGFVDLGPVGVVTAKDVPRGQTPITAAAASTLTKVRQLEAAHRPTGMANAQPGITHPSDAELGQPVSFDQCADIETTGDGDDDEQTIQGCNSYAGSVVVDADGNLSGSIQVWATFDPVGFIGGIPFGSAAGVSRPADVSLFGLPTVNCLTVAGGCTIVINGGDPLDGATAPISFAGDTLLVRPTLTVTPASGIHDGDVVTVTGAGYLGHTNVVVFACLAEDGHGDQCDPTNPGVAITDGNGHFQMQMSIHTTLAGTPFTDVPLPPGDPFPPTNCATSPGGCRLLAVANMPASRWPSATLGFAAPPPTTAAAPKPVTVNPAFTG